MNVPASWIIVVVAPLALLGIALGRYPVFRMNRATIALVGATLLILSGAMSLESAYEAVDLNTIVLIFAMMVLNVNLRLAGFFNIISAKIVSFAKTPRQLLFLLIFSSGILSGLFLNDTIVLMFTPLILDIVMALNRNPIPYLIALATAANIGSAATIVGNPQNMLIGMYSEIPFTAFFLRLAPISLAGLFLIFAVIVLMYRKEFRSGEKLEPSVQEFRIFKPLLYKSILVMGLMLIAFCAGVKIPLAAIGAASLLLVTRRIKPERIFREIDWSLLVFFSGLFIITDSFAPLVKDISGNMSGFAMDLHGIAGLSLVSAVLSNLISNVPAVLLISPHIKEILDANAAWLTLAMATTLAGNFTLLGSVANLIVAEMAKQKRVIIKFGEYFKTGAIITVLSLVAGILWLSLF